MSASVKLFDFQNDGVSELLKGFIKHRIQCLAWYTGSGKTNVFSEMCRLLINNDPNIKIGISAYLTTEIKEQIGERLKMFGLQDKTQIVYSGVPINLTKNIFVFNPQTLFRKPPEIDFDFFILDEGHAGLAEGCMMIRKIMAKTCRKKTKILLVSATPWDTLALKEFKNVPVLKRPLDQGLKDGLVTDFQFHAEEAQITFTEEDFNRSGDLGRSAVQRSMAILKSACIGKMEHLIATYDKELGKKVLVICPPGNYTEVPRTMAKHFGGLTFIQNRLLDSSGEHRTRTEQDSHLHKFKNDPSVRFLFVAQKCQVGFDMAELASVVDLTMTRNIRVLAQRCGRIARKNGKQNKHYFYVYDQSLMKDRLEWIVATMIDFCLGAYDGWTTKTAKYRKVHFGQWNYRTPFAMTLSEVVAALRDPGMIQNARTLAFVQGSPPTKWTLKSALAKAAEYPSRHEMWKKNPAVYKWLRLNAKKEMDLLFPMVNQLGKWNERTVIAALKEAKKRKLARKQFKYAYGGVDDWIKRNNRQDLLDKYIERAVSKWTEERATATLATVKIWGDVRRMGGFRGWMRRNGGEDKWRKIWTAMVLPEKMLA